MGRMKKRLSKRLTLKLKHKVERKVKEAHKKQRKDAKTNPKKRKDPGIPNSWPYKEEELHKLEVQRAKVKLEKERQKALRTKQAAKKRQQVQQQLQQQQQQGGSVSASDLLNAQQRAAEFENNNDSNESNDANNQPGTRLNQRTALRELRTLIDMSDVLLEVVDARDPMGCRCKNLELAVDADVSKKIVVVLNKIDLVPRSAVQKWLAYLRQTHPAIAFKATTQGRQRVGGHHKAHNQTTTATKASESLLNSSESVGADTLVMLLKNYARSHDMKKSISVGVFGYPNVGKSSLINSLKRSNAVGVSSCPGFTRKVTQIYLDKHIKLVDCPGVVFDTTANNNSAQVVLRNAVAVEKVVDPIRVVEAIIERCTVPSIARHYEIGTFDNTTTFLINISRKRGKLLKGGKCDLESAARTVLKDWNSGAIPFYTLPPVDKTAVENQQQEEASGGTQVVSQWAKEFDLQALFAEEEKAISALPAQDNQHLCLAPGSNSGGAMMDSDDDDDDDSADEME